MTKHILITDTLFIYDEHEELLKGHGYIVDRLTKSDATEEELCDAIQGKHGYILGGVEKVTTRVIDAADTLEAIAFTGSGYTEWILAHKEATEKGIAISACKGANAQSVAEYTMLLILAMARNLPALTTQGGVSFSTTREIAALTLGVVGYGHIGRRVAELARAFGMKVVVVNRTPVTERQSDLGVEFVSFDELLARSDIVTLHVNKQHGSKVIGAPQLSIMKDGAILINTAFPHAVDNHALHAEIMNKRLSAAFDAPADVDFSNAPLGYYMESNAQTAFNTLEANKRISDRATSALINMLETGEHADLVNPEYRSYRVRR